MTKRIIIYHDDADGRCAAAIAAMHGRRIHGHGMEVKFIPMDYGKKIPDGVLAGFVPSSIENDVWLLDFSLPEDEMDALESIAGVESLMWIDHHVTAIEKLARFEHWSGVRRSGRAACMLTWVFCGGSEEAAPLAVQLIADRDTWKFEYGAKSHWFHAALDLYDTRPENIELWEFAWLRPQAQMELMLIEGRAIYDARRKKLATVIRRFGRVEKLHGTDMTVLSVNYPGSGDLGEIGREMGHDVVHSYVDQEKDGRLCRVHNLYSSKDIDVGRLAKERGGGGHKNAAGWVVRL